MSNNSEVVIGNTARSHFAVYDLGTHIQIKIRGGYIGDALSKTQLKRLLIRAAANKKLLILDHSNEIHLWWKNNHQESVFDILHGIADNICVDPSIITLQTSNLLCAKAYTDWAAINNTQPSMVIESLMSHAAIIYSMMGTEFDVNTYADSPKPSVFTCWLGRTKQHKLAVAKWLYSAGFLTSRKQAACVSLLSDYTELYPHIETVDLELHHILSNYRSIEGTATIARWQPGPKFYQAHMNTYFDFIVEPITEEDSSKPSELAQAHAWNQTLCAVERVFRAILLRRPFILLGNANTLKLLHNLGFKTFPTLFDESYDSLNYSDRFDHITKQIESLVVDPQLHAKVYNKTIADAVLHNYENLKHYGPKPVKYLDALSHY
jgi:hypothetical protein